MKKNYIVGSIVLLIIIIALICIGISRCTQPEQQGQEQGNGYESNHLIQGTPGVDEKTSGNDDEINSENMTQDNQLEVKQEQEKDKGTLQEWTSTETTNKENTGVSEQDKDKTPEGSGTSDNTNEDEGTLSSKDTDDDSDKKWSPFYK